MSGYAHVNRVTLTARRSLPVFPCRLADILWGNRHVPKMPNPDIRHGKIVSLTMICKAVRHAHVEKLLAPRNWSTVRSLRNSRSDAILRERKSGGTANEADHRCHGCPC